MRVALCLLFLLLPFASAQNWRSALYSEQWLPIDAGGRATPQGFLQDFSYAGYRQGDRPIPQNPGSQSLGVDRQWADGLTDATHEIQSKIDQACNGGGVVNLPPGIFRIRPKSQNPYSLVIPCDKVVLRGSLDAKGLPSTYLFNDEPTMADKSVLRIGPKNPNNNWYSGDNEYNEVKITQDLPFPIREIPVASNKGYAAGDRIMIRTDITDAFRADHGMQGLWGKRPGLLYRRSIVAVRGNTLLIDEPTRYPIKTRDNARVVKLKGSTVEDSGVENLYIGMRENSKSSEGDNDYKVAGTAAYEVNGSSLIEFHWAENDWAKNIRSYKPATNRNNIHLLSIGIHTTPSSRGITVEGCSLANPQYKGGGGNGYLYWIQGQDGLFKENQASEGRHNFTFSRMEASGNVLLRNVSVDGRYPDDFHDTLSHGNLIDGHTLIREQFLANNRLEKSNDAGITASQNVFWRVRGEAYKEGGTESSGVLIDAHQFGSGYIIGTFGPASAVNSNNYLEGIGKGETLWPRSLYEDQKFRRDNNPSY